MVVSTLRDANLRCSECMSKNLFDQFSKQFLEEFLSPLGAIETSYEVSGEPQFRQLSRSSIFLYSYLWQMQFKSKSNILLQE
jgi:hypothetical protein